MSNRSVLYSTCNLFVIKKGVRKKELKINYPMFPDKIKKYEYKITHIYKLEKRSNRIIHSKILMQEKIDDVFEVVVEHKLNLANHE